MNWLGRNLALAIAIIPVALILLVLSECRK